MQKYLLRLAVFSLSATIGAVSALCQREKNPEWPSAEGELKAVDPIRRMYVSESDPDLPRSLSPHDISLFVSHEPNLSLFKLWKALKIDPNEFHGMRSTNADFFPRMCHNCEAEIWKYDLDGEPGTEALLRISEPLGQYCRYLIFKYANKEWKLVGHIDAWGKYQSPQHTLIVNRGVTWLAIRNQGANGSGVASYIDFVYLVTPRRVVEAFSYRAEGIQAANPESLGRQFSGRVVDCSLRNGVVTAELAYSVIYGGRETDLFSDQHRVVLTNRLGGWDSRFDQARSNIAEEEFESAYNIDTFSNEVLLQQNYRELSQIARGQDVEKKETLREFLKSCEDSPERRQLSHLLNSD